MLPGFPSIAHVLTDSARARSSVRTEPAAFSVTGMGALQCLQGLLTNDLVKPGDHSLVYGALLTPKGMIVVDFWVLRRPQRIPAARGTGRTRGCLRPVPAAASASPGPDGGSHRAIERALVVRRECAWNPALLPYWSGPRSRRATGRRRVSRIRAPDCEAPYQGSVSSPGDGSRR